MNVNKKDTEWQKKLYKKAKNIADERYHPDLNVELPLLDSFDGLVRSENFYSRCRKLFGELKKHTRSLTRNSDSPLKDDLTNIEKALYQVLIRLEKVKTYSIKRIVWKSVDKKITLVQELIRKLQDKIYQLEIDEKPEKGYWTSPYQGEKNDLHQLTNQLYKVKQFINSKEANLSNKRSMLMMGGTGSGKTHLLCDLFRSRLALNRFTFMAQGEEFNQSQDFWDETIRLNKDKRINTKFQLLKKFNTLGKRSECRFLFIIDALNETEFPIKWRPILSDLVKEIKKYPHIALVVSVRSGFESEVITSPTRHKFIEIYHGGFEYKESEAQNKFFTHYNIPLPEFPLLNPEFTNPLFLLLFCQSRKSRKEKNPDKQLYRGHEGSSSIFEEYIKAVGEKIGKGFGITAHNFWDKAIKPIAESMVDTPGQKDRVSQKILIKYLSQSLPGIDYLSLLTALEKNHLLVKFPRRGDNNGICDYDYRFTHQRFSDHLIARSILNKYGDKNVYGDAAQAVFESHLKKNGQVGKYFSDYSFRGVMEALCVQVPERFKGVELIDLCPWAEDLLEDAFLESLIWRKVGAFSLDKNGRPKRAIELINSRFFGHKGASDKFFSTILNVASVPAHPLNSEMLHSYLMKLGISARDGIWSTFLHYHYEKGQVVDRVLYWVLDSNNIDSMSYESKELLAILIAWFLTTPNRVVRDKATRALVKLFNQNPDLVLKINLLFRNVDDPYVKERVSASTYGALLRLRRFNHKSVTKLGEFVFDEVFSGEKEVRHILIRDYSLNTLNLLIREKAFTPSNPNKVKPKLNSKWPKRLYSMKTLESKFEPKNFNWQTASLEDKGVRGIWNSFEGMGDFSNYIVSPAIRHWSRIKAGDPAPPNVDELEEQFLIKLSKKQQELYKQISDFRPFLRIFIRFRVEQNKLSAKEKEELQAQRKLEDEINELKRHFLESLNTEQKNLYNEIVSRKLGKRSKIPKGFDLNLANRWVIKRVFEMYDSKSHGEFDGLIGDRINRSPSSVERVGKKYQWIALHELLGLLVDNFRFLEDTHSEKYKEYEGVWELHLRDIDPTLLASRSKTIDSDYYIGNVTNWNKKPTQKTSWIRQRANLPNPKQYLTLKGLKGDTWCVLSSMCKWEEPAPPEFEKYDQPSKDIFYLFQAYLVEEKHSENVYNWLSRKNFHGRWMPESRDGSNEYFYREYPNSDVYKKYVSRYEPPEKWIAQVRHKEKIPGRIMLASDLYSGTSSSRDNSYDHSFNISVPSPGLVEEMNLVSSDNDGYWENKEGITVVGDLSLKFGGESMLAMQKSYLIDFLKKKKFVVVWSLLGEKRIIRRGGNGEFSTISGVYLLDQSGQIKGGYNLTTKTY